LVALALFLMTPWPDESSKVSTTPPAEAPERGGPGVDAPGPGASRPDRPARTAADPARDGATELKPDRPLQPTKESSDDEAAAEAMVQAFAARMVEAPYGSEGISDAEYRARRDPIIAAVRRSELSPEGRHEAMTRALEESGTSSEPWTHDFPATADTWRARMPPETRPQLGQPRCFRGGCLQPVAFASMEDYQAAAEAFRRLDDRDLLHGGRMLLPPRTHADGSIGTGWILLPPRP
jgi:hypothetical protein